MHVSTHLAASCPHFSFGLETLLLSTSGEDIDLAASRASIAERGVRGNQRGFCGGNAAEWQLLRASRARGQCVCGCGLRALTGSAEHAWAWRCDRSDAPARFKIGSRHSLPPQDGRQPDDYHTRSFTGSFTAVAIHRVPGSHRSGHILLDRSILSFLPAQWLHTRARSRSQRV